MESSWLGNHARLGFGDERCQADREPLTPLARFARLEGSIYNECNYRPANVDHESALWLLCQFSTEITPSRCWKATAGGRCDAAGQRSAGRNAGNRTGAPL